MKNTCVYLCTGPNWFGELPSKTRWAAQNMGRFECLFVFLFFYFFCDKLVQTLEIK